MEVERKTIREVKAFYFSDSMFNALSELRTRAQAFLFVLGPEHGMSTQGVDFNRG